MELHCAYSEGMLAWEPAGTEADAARAIALHPMAKAVHEAGHAVVGLALGAPLRRLAVVDEDTGTPAPGAAPKFGGRTEFGEGGRGQKETICPCWRVKLMHGVLTCGGPAAERKFRLAERLPQVSLHTAQSDRNDMRALAQAVWLGAGRDGLAFSRLAWRSAQRIVDEPPIWAAIEAVAQAVLAQPVQAGERVLPGSHVKQIMSDCGIEPGALREAFFARCFTPTCCPRNRKASRRFEHSLSWWTMVDARLPPPPPPAATKSKKKPLVSRDAPFWRRAERFNVLGLM